MGLHRRLQMGALLLTALLWPVGVASIIVARDALATQAADRMAQLTRDQLGELDRAMAEALGEWQVYVASPYVQQALAQSNAEFAAMPDPEAEIDARDKAWAEVPDGEQNDVMAASLGHVVAQDLSSRLAALEQQHGYLPFGEAFITNAYGANVAQTARTSDYRQSDEDWWQEALKTGTFIGDVEFDDSAGIFSIDVAVAVPGPDGKPVGVLKAPFDIRGAFQSLEQCARTQTGLSLALLTSDLKLVATDQGPAQLEDGAATIAGLQPDAIGSEQVLNVRRKLAEDGDVFTTALRSDGHLGWILVVDQSAAQILGPVQRLRNVLLLLTVLATAVGLVVATWLSRSLAGPIVEAMGHLTVVADRIRVEAARMAGSSSELADATNQQAAALQEITASIDDIAATVARNADGTREAQQVSADASRSTVTGDSAMGLLGERMEQVKSSSAETAGVVKTIDEIAFQTNLLALNAAVEAARAGDAGKGFAVVADEVRRLAQRSAEAARGTTELIEDSQRSAASSIEASRDVERALADIRAAVERTSALIAESAAASAEQSQGIQQISQALGDVDRIVQEGAANAQAVADVSEALSDEVEVLDRAVDALGQVVGRTGQAAAPPARREASFSAGSWLARRGRPAAEAPPAEERAEAVLDF